MSSWLKQDVGSSVYYKTDPINEKILSYLKGEGFTYLWREFGERAYRPMKGTLEQLLAGTCKTPLWEDDLSSIPFIILLFAFFTRKITWIIRKRKH